MSGEAAGAARAVAARLEGLGATFLAPPVLQPADLYIELGGESVRGRTFTVVDGRGQSFALRPDLTAPAARAALAQPLWDTGAFWVWYDGPVFRREGEDAAEFRQLGAERYAPRPADPEEDARVIAAALDAADAAGVSADLRLGDVALFAAAAQSLDLPPGWSARFARAFAAPGGPLAALAEAERPADGPGPEPLEEALALLAPADAAAAVERLWAAQGLSPVGERGPEEVARRLREKAEARAAARPSPQAVAALREVLALEGAPQETLRALAKRIPKAAALEAAIARAEARLAALARLRPGPLAVRLSPGYGRGLAYYDGFVFELEAAGVRLGGGGRYDRLLAEIARREGMSATGDWGAAGFGLRPDRLAEARGRAGARP